VYVVRFIDYYCVLLVGELVLHKKTGYARFEFFTEVTMKNAFFWDFIPCDSRIRSSETSLLTRSNGVTSQKTTFFKKKGWSPEVVLLMLQLRESSKVKDIIPERSQSFPAAVCA
jgi:hypothetical protein